jgi:hypothetical protein
MLMYCCIVLLVYCHVVLLVYCCVVVLFLFKRLVVCCSFMSQKSYHHQQYDKIRISYSFKDPTEKGLNASEKLQHVPEERSRRKNWAIR